MTHSAADPDSRSILPGRALAYVPGPRGLENAPLQDFSALVGAGSAWSTARDLHALVQAIVTGRMVRGARASYVRSGHLDFNGRAGGFKAWALWDGAGWRSSTGSRGVITTSRRARTHRDSAPFGSVPMGGLLLAGATLALGRRTAAAA